MYEPIMITVHDLAKVCEIDINKARNAINGYQGLAMNCKRGQARYYELDGVKLFLSSKKNYFWKRHRAKICAYETHIRELRNRRLGDGFNSLPFHEQRRLRGQDPFAGCPEILVEAIKAGGRIREWV